MWNGLFLYQILEIIKYLSIILFYTGRYNMCDERFDNIILVKNIFDAVKYNDPDEVEKYILQGAMEDINEYKQTPLLMALNLRFFDIAMLLIKNGCNINCKDRIGKSPLHLLIELIFCSGGYINYKKIILEITELILQNGARVNEKDKYGRTPFFYINESAERVAFEDMFPPDYFKNMLYDYVSYIKNKTIGHPLIILTDEELNGLSEARPKTEIPKDEERIARFFEERKEQWKEEVKIWHRDSMHLIELFIDYGAFFNIRDIDGKTIFHYSTLNKNAEILKILTNRISVDSACDNKGFTSKMFHAFQGENSAESTDDLYSAWGLNSRDNNNKTPLLYAIERRNIPAEKTILKTLYSTDIIDNLYRLNFFMRKKNSPNPIKILIENDYIKILAEYLDEYGNSRIKNRKKGMLLEQQASINWLSPLLIAAEKKKMKIIEFIIRKNFSANPDNQKFIETFLNVFNKGSDDEKEFEYIIRLFINRLKEQNEIIGLWVNETSQGSTPLSISREKGLGRIKTLLVENGADKQG